MESIKNAPTKEKLEFEMKREKVKTHLKWLVEYHSKRSAMAQKALDLTDNADETLLSVLENVK